MLARTCVAVSWRLAQGCHRVTRWRSPDTAGTESGHADRPSRLTTRHAEGHSGPIFEEAALLLANIRSGVCFLQFVGPCVLQLLRLGVRSPPCSRHEARHDWLVVACINTWRLAGVATTRVVAAMHMAASVFVSRVFNMCVNSMKWSSPSLQQRLPNIIDCDMVSAAPMISRLQVLQELCDRCLVTSPHIIL